MSTTTVVINVLALACFALAFAQDRAKARRALVLAFRSFLRILPAVLTVVVVIGLLLGLVPKSTISRIVGEQGGVLGLLTVASLGAVLHIPSLIAFPLAASLLQAGASITAVAVFITTLTMIGVVTLPLEIRELGAKMALLRNGLSFLAALAIGVLMGVIL
ncbi:MAG: permease [Calditrichaeota bacterium]|nr:permease [Calditrichota bacterium]